MSGGVDSSLSAALVREAGHEVVGITLKLWPCAEVDGGFVRDDACCSPTETMDARAVALSTGVKHYVVDHEAEFRRGVVANFLDGYRRGEIPNPCVRCNETVKFGSLWDHAQQLGAERVATGHYARVAQAFDRHLLRCAVDRVKDQTYFLFSLTQEQLAHAEFPVGHLTKEAVREQSRARGLSTADKHESQDICFIGSDGISAFLRREIPEAFSPGEVRLAADGRRLGEHLGLGAFTIGQRKGLGIAWHETLFVVDLDPATNTVWLGPREALLVSELPLRDCTWHVHPPTANGLACKVRLRHRGVPVPAIIVSRPGLGREGKPNAVVRFATPQQRPSAGQACVAYDDAIEHCLGGGWIDSKNSSRSLSAALPDA